MRRLFSLDAATQSVEHFHYDEQTGQVTIEDIQRVDDILDANHAFRGETVSQKNTFRKVASVPLNIYMEMEKKFREQGLSTREKRKAWAKWLNDSDHNLFKTTDARI